MSAVLAPWMPAWAAVESRKGDYEADVAILYRLSEREAAAYAFLRGIDYIVEECPFAAGATSIAHKEILTRMEEASPGAKHNFLFGFLDKARAAFERAEAVSLNECARCGQVTTGTVCAFCKLADQVKRANFEGRHGSAGASRE